MQLRLTAYSAAIFTLIIRANHTGKAKCCLSHTTADYCGRSEFEAKYLPDHEIRLRMSRGRIVVYGALCLSELHG
jgi:hypothetical protein